jgi:hypothetical protein
MTDEHDAPVTIRSAGQAGGVRGTELLLLAVMLVAVPLVVFETATGASVEGRDETPGPFALYLAAAGAGAILAVLQDRAGQLRLTARRLRTWLARALVALPIAAFLVRLAQGLSLAHTPGKIGLPLLYALPVFTGLVLWASLRREAEH